VRIPPGPEEWKRFDGAWKIRSGGATGSFSLAEGIGYCTVSRGGEKHTWVIELLEIYGGDLLEFGLYPLGDPDEVTSWTGTIRSNGDIRVYGVAFPAWPLPKAPFILRRG